jgi:hypothetical protein
MLQRQPLVLWVCICMSDQVRSVHPSIFDWGTNLVTHSTNGSASGSFNCGAHASKSYLHWNAYVQHKRDRNHDDSQPAELVYFHRCSTGGVHVQRLRESLRHVRYTRLSANSSTDYLASLGHFLRHAVVASSTQPAGSVCVCSCDPSRVRSSLTRSHISLTISNPLHDLHRRVPSGAHAGGSTSTTEREAAALPELAGRFRHVMTVGRAVFKQFLRWSCLWETTGALWPRHPNIHSPYVAGIRAYACPFLLGGA